MTARLLLLAVLMSAGSLPAQQGPPRSFQVVRVPVPESLRSARLVSYAAFTVNNFSLVGRGAGSLDSSSATNALITIAIPAHAGAGTRLAARVLFIAQGREVTVPIEMTVTPVRALHIAAPTELPALRAGERVEIFYQIENRGNAEDTVTLRLEVPAGWRGSDSIRVVIPAFGSVRQGRRIDVPRISGTGNFFVRAHVASRAARADVLTTLTVGPDFDALRPPGAAARVSVGSVTADGVTETVPQLALTGPLTSDIQVDGRLTLAPTLTAPLVRGLATVGTFVTDPHLVAWTPRWRATLGSTVLAMTDLTGVNAGGRGFAFEHSDTTRRIEVTAARAGAASIRGDDDGELYGAHFEQRFRYLRAGATATYLRGVGFRQDELTAFGVQARSHPIHTLTFGGETAYRRFLNGSGVGWSARVRHDRDNDRAELQVTHAPGGTRAFARAENEVHFSFLAAPTKRLDLAGSLVDARDEGQADYAFHTRSAALSPSWLFSELIRLRADIRHTTFEVSATPIGYGNKETHVSLGVGGAWRGFGYFADAGMARLERSISAADIDAADTGTRFTWRTNLSRATRNGVFQLESNYERNSPGTGYLPQQVMVNVRGDRIQIPALSSRLELDAEYSLQSWTGVSATHIMRAGAQYLLPRTTLALGVERNPMLSGIGRHTPWVVALRVERSLGLPRIHTGRAHGMVYRDYNGNGQRDVNEPGVPNVGVRRGASRAITGEDGGYRFWEATHGSTTVDPATLPFGWMTGQNDDHDIGLVATTRLLVTLELGAAERLRNLDISNVAVLARDAYGREWRARRTGNEQALFEALPVGRYTVTADFAALGEPLRVPEDVTVEVKEGELAEVKLQIAGRPLRFRNQP